VIGHSALLVATSGLLVAAHAGRRASNGARQRAILDQGFAVRMLVRPAHRMEHRYPVRWPSPGATRP